MNGKRYEASGPEVTREELVALVQPGGDVGQGDALTVSFRRGGPPQTEGVLHARQRVFVVPDQVFNVALTTHS